ncbi:RNA polymerase sigma factor [Candidatus Woesearchaeota archaeon]|nr:RNA polymerase sigma factor [Candidatus Woesearchaeota archaeon]
MNHQEFINLYDENVAGIYRYIFLRVSSKETAQDLTSEVFLRTWEYVGLPATVSVQIKSPRAFFYRVAKNLVVDFYREKSKAPISLDELEIQIPDAENNPEEKTGLALEMVSVQRALSGLKNDYRDVIIWHYLDDLSVPEIADILGKSEGAVRVILHRGLESARQLVDKSV